MASTYSSRLRIELMANGEKSTTWGTITSSNLELLEAGIAGRAAITHDDTASYTLSTANGSADEARCMILNVAGTLTAARNAVVPTVSQAHVVKNATSGGYAVTLKTSGGTGIAIPNGKTTLLFCDGTNVVNAIDYLNTLTAGTFGVRSSGAAYDLQIANTEVLTANRALTVTLNDAARTLNMGGNITTAGALTTSGAYGLTVTLTDTTAITLPTSGTLGITLGTEQATTSGTAIDFTGIPSWARRITINFVGVSTNGSSPLCVQIGDSGGIETTGYVSAVYDTNDFLSSAGTASFIVGCQTIASYVYSGSITLNLENSSNNTWCSSGNLATNVGGINVSGGKKALSAALDRLRITTSGGSDVFNAGSINISYER